MLSWVRTYSKDKVSGDISAGIIVATMLVPQSMAYAMLAGMPPVTGLYACIAPVMLYAVFGSSNYLAVGPVAVVALMVAEITSQFVAQGVGSYESIAVTLSMLCGLSMVLFSLFRFGVLANFLSHSVIAGFINAACVLIIASQLGHILGLDIGRGDSFLHTLQLISNNVSNTNYAALAVSGITFVILLLFGKPLAGWLQNRSGSHVHIYISKMGPLLVVVLGCIVTWLLSLDAEYRLAIVGEVPTGLPGFLLPAFDTGTWLTLLPAALLIAFVSYLESISIGRSLASKRREKVKPNQELFAIGTANIASALSSSFAVGGGFARSGVNFSAGANTPLASLITSGLMLLTLVFFAPLFYHLPSAVLAVIVCMAVINLFDMKSIVEAWKFNRADAISSIVTFVLVLVVGVEHGILGGILLSLGLYLWRTSKPHMAVVGRVGDTQHFRNVERHKVRTEPNIIAIRIDESLYFANAHALESKILNLITKQKDVSHVVLICSAINFIDFSALDTLEGIREKLHDAGVLLHLAEVKGPVMDKLRQTDFYSNLGEGKVFLSTHDAFKELEIEYTDYHI